MPVLFPRAVPLAVPFVFILCSSAVHGFQPSPPGPAPVEIAPRTAAAPRPEGLAPEPYLRVDASMVLVPVQATRPSGAPVTTLLAGDFRLYEDGDQQNIRYFVHDESPVSIGVLVDSSASMKNKTRRAADATAALLKSSNPQDEYFVVEFDERARLQLPFTNDADAVYREVSHTRPFGRTSLFDAIHLALQTMRKAQHSRKALIILSDGGDNHSRRSFSAIREAVTEAEVAIYAVGIFEPAGSTPDSKEEAAGPDLLNQIAELTGGRHFSAQLEDLSSVSRTIGQLMHHRYLIGYTPQNGVRDGTFRAIQLELVDTADPVSLRYRRGYKAPVR